MVSTPQIAIGVTTCCVVLITSSVLLGVSFDTLEPTQMGIIFDANVQHVETDKVYFSGRYLTGLGRKFIGFPLTQQTLRFGASMFTPATSNIVCRSHDGLSIDVEVAVQYSLSRNASDLWRLYMDLGTSYNDVYSLMVEQVVQDVFSDYYTLDFFEDRVIMENDIYTQLSTKLARLYAVVDSVQLMRVNIEDTSPTLVDAVEATQIAIQDVYQAMAEQTVAQVNADALVGVATEVANVQLLNANATALSYIAATQAAADALYYRIDTQSQALLNLRNTLGLNTSIEVLAYEWLVSMQENTIDDVLMSFQYPSILQKVVTQT